MSPVYTPLIMENSLLCFYFLAFFLLGPVALMSIVTSIMVESSIRTANEDVEAKATWEKVRRKAMRPRLTQIFEELDVDGSGEIDLEELLAASPEATEQITRMINMDQLKD